jgi:hypothetical protein
MSLRHSRTVKRQGTESPIELTLGERYHPELSNKTIAREVKQLIVEAIKAGLLPFMKVSVTSSKGSVEVWILQASFTYGSEAFHEAKGLITQFLLAYQKQEHWINGDYIDNNFSDFVYWWVNEEVQQ